MQLPSPTMPCLGAAQKPQCDASAVASSMHQNFCTSARYHAVTNPVESAFTAAQTKKSFASFTDNNSPCNGTCIALRGHNALHVCVFPMARITVSPRNSNAFLLHDIWTTSLYRPCRMLRVAHHGHRCAHDVCAALSVGAHCLHSAVQHHHQPENNLVCSSSGIEVSIAAHRCAICWVDGRDLPI